MKIPRTAVARVVTAVLECPDLKRATLYLDAKTTVKATRPIKYGGRKRAETLIVTVGTPNYAERKFIRLCQKAGEPLPIRELQLKWWPKSRK